MSQPKAISSSLSLSAVRLVCRDGAETIVWLGGESDAATVHELRGVLAGAVAADRNDLVIDVADVTFMDATTLGALMGSRNDLRELERFMTVRGSVRCVDRLFELCDVASFFDGRPSTTGRSQDVRCAGTVASSLRPANGPLRLHGRSAFRDRLHDTERPVSPLCAARGCAFWSEPGVCTFHPGVAA